MLLDERARKSHRDLGRFIGTVFDGERPAGTNSVWLDGARLGPGAYFYRLSTNGRRLEKKMVLSR